MSEKIPITIIGGGVIGCAIAYRLAKTLKEQIVLVERNSQILGENQSSRNSGVVHAGIYYPKDMGPLKARLCIEGNRMLYDFCEEYNIPHKKTGKLVVATDLREEEYLEDVYRIAQDNSVAGIKKIGSKDIRKYEPNIKAVSALHVSTSGIVDASQLISKLYKLAESLGVIFLTGNEVISISIKGEEFTVTVNSKSLTETFKTAILINAAGLYSDDIARMVNPDSPYRMDPIRGEYVKFYKTRRDNILMNGMNVYPVPCGYLQDGRKLEAPFKEFWELFSKGKITKSVGIHLTPTFDIAGGKYIIGRTVTVGPAYTRPDGKEDYNQTRKGQYYLDMVDSFFPNLRLEDISLHQAGIRAKLKDYYDFIIERDKKHPNCINLIGIDSPGLTSSLAIAKYVSKMLF
jgi:L-2-hydroxyglutarate oxidase LhgO